MCTWTGLARDARVADAGYGRYPITHAGNSTGNSQHSLPAGGAGVVPSPALRQRVWRAPMSSFASAMAAMAKSGAADCPLRTPETLAAPSAVATLLSPFLSKAHAQT